MGQYVPGAPVNRKVIIDEDVDSSVCLFDGNGKSFQPSLTSLVDLVSFSPPCPKPTWGNYNW